MNNIIFLTDDETGEEIEFEIIDAVEKDGDRFILVVPVEEDGEEDEALILKDVSENDEEAVYQLIEDEEELIRAAQYFMDEDNDYDLDF
ncbi:DUF1292 domain-containing protein [Defluviitalea raffinosedens]|uniref:DUF1292 domain-containing protein n=2 Tax=Defluviitalea raffinosedens TaxID=1450156 RepID=A0A7C8HGL7_9FIRM|nr:DUF1292 domain-containing protein [Defluviitalea raffinosedens]HHW66705.1 DUF1292 domain-containing protein [Candidatus Epulonipiscium sp.]